MTIFPARLKSRKKAAWIAALAVLAALIFLWPYIRPLVEQVFWGLLLTGLALPLAKLYEKKLSSSLSATLALGTLSAGFILFLLLFVPLIVRQGQQLAQLLPGVIEQGQALFSRLKEYLAGKGFPVEAVFRGDLFSALGGQASDTLPSLVSKAGDMAGGLSRLLIAPVFAFYFLKDRGSLSQTLLMWVPLRYRSKAVAACREVRREIAGFCRGQLLISLVVGGLTALGLLIVNVPAWLLLGVLMGILELVPYLGPFLAAIPVVLCALPSGIGKTLWALGVLIAVQQLEGGMISPKLMSGATKLHPVTVLLAISAGGLWGGVGGMLLALPLVVSLRGAFRVLRLTNVPEEKSGFQQEK